MKVEEKVKVEITQEEQELFDKQFEADYDNAVNELERAEKSLKEHQFVYNQQITIRDLMKKAKDVILNNIEVVNPTYKYETMPEYTELLRAQENLKFDQNYYTLEEISIPGMEKTLKAKEEAIASLTEKIDKMKGE